MAERLEYVGPFDSVQVLVGGAPPRYASVANAAWDGKLPEAVEGLPRSIVVSDELAATLLPPEGDESGVWRRAGGKAAAKDAVDDPSHPALRWEAPEGALAVHPVTGYVSPAELREQEAAIAEGNAAVTAPVTDPEAPSVVAEAENGGEG